jgi:hypothetical protein
MALSLSPGTFGPAVATGEWLAANQAATMYRITTDFWGSQGAVLVVLVTGLLLLEACYLDLAPVALA